MTKKLRGSVEQLLVANAGTLSPLLKIQRQILAGGSESVVLIDGDDVLLVTRKHLGMNIEFLHGLPLDDQPFVKPKIVAIDADLASLIDPDSKPRAKRIAKERSAVFYPELWTKNVVYRLPRYDGTLEDLKSVSFKETDIQNLEKILTKALKFLHTHGLTHNDIALKNIFYKGEYPDLHFYLGDFGSLSKNDENAHNLKKQLDLARLTHVVGKVKAILEFKNDVRTKLNDPSQQQLPSYNNRLRARLGISPMKPLTPVVQKVESSTSNKLAAKKLRFI